MNVVVSPQAEKRLHKISKLEQIALIRKITNLSENPNQNQADKLKGYKDIFRVRVGDYRIVYRHSSDKIYIILIGHRKDVYDILHQLISHS